VTPPSRRRPPLLLWVLLGIVAVTLVLLVINHESGETFGIPNGDLAQAVVLIAILIFISAGVLGRQIGVGTIMRSMLGWAAAILIVAGLYASRDQLGIFAGRLLGALAPGLPITGHLSGEANPEAVSVFRAGDGHFAIRADVDGVPLTLLVDTGASFLTLTHKDARTVGFDPDRLDYSVPIRTANGSMTAAAILIGKITVGSIERRNVRALVAPPQSLEQSLLGMTFLNTLNGYAISGDRLVLTP
jgi:aspartyl protease family protein